MPLPSVAIVVLNHNRPAETADCLASLARLDYPRRTVVLVENGSSEAGLTDAAHARDAALTVLRSEQNLGFAAGCNLGVRWALAAGHDYVLLLNNDTLVDPLSLQHLVRAMEEGAPAGLGGAKILYHERPETIWFAGAERHHQLCAAVGTGHGDPDDGRHDRQREVRFLCGCALLVSRQVWERVGLFDERLFMYYEDSDLCERAREAGFRLLYVPEAVVWHRVPYGVGWELSSFKIYHRARSSAIFFRKHCRRPRLAFVLLTRALFGLSLAWHGRGPRPLLWHLRGLRDGISTPLATEALTTRGQRHQGRKG